MSTRSANPSIPSQQRWEKLLSR